MPDPTEPSRTVAASSDQPASAANSTDETAPRAAPAPPRFGPPAAPDEVGTLGPYRVVKQLGQGGMGAVYLAIDTRLDRKLALKVMLPEFAADRAAKERFLREARAAAKITHDNVVTVFEADERDGVPYIAMQFLQGYPLDDYLRTKGAPALAHVIRIGREAAAGLAAAHELGLVHRDIKPANLWLEAPNGRVKVLDFGLAKPTGTDAELTKSGAVVGTPAYMSPEQARGSKVDHRTDLFSLGAVLYRLCTGQNPFAGSNVMAVLMALGSDDPTPVRQLNPSVPEALARLIHQLLAKKAELRPQTATEVAKRLRAILDQLLNPGAPPSTSSGTVPAMPSAAELSVSQPVVVNPLPMQPPVVVPMDITATPESVFANLGEADEPPPAEPVDAATEPRSERRYAERKRPPRTGGKGVLIGVGLAVLLAGGVVALVVSQTGKKREPEAKAPDAPDTGRGKDRPTPSPRPGPKGETALLPPKPWTPPAAVPVGASPFDKLDPSEIPKADRFDWQPKGLVAVAGTHSPRTWVRQADGANLAVSRDGSLIAVGGAFSPLRVWDVKSRALKADLPGYQGYAAAFAPDGKTVYADTHANNRFVRWDLTEPSAPAAPWEGGPMWETYTLGIWLSPDGSRAVIHNQNGVAVWDLTAKPAKVLAKFPTGWTAVTPDGNRMASYHPTDKRVLVHDISATDVKERYRLDTVPQYLALSPDGTRLATANASGKFSLFDLTAANPTAIDFGTVRSIHGPLAFSPDGKRLVTQDQDNALRLWDVTGVPKELWAKPLPVFGVGIQPAQVAFAGEGGNTLVAWSGLGLVHFIDASGSEPKWLNPIEPSEPVGPTLAFDGLSGRVVLSRAADQRHQWWDFGRAKPTPTDLVAPRGAAAFAPNGAKVVVWDAAKNALVPFAGGTAGAPLPLTSPHAVFASDGRTCWTAGGSRAAEWDLSGAEPREVRSLDTGGGATQLSLHRNDTVLAVSADKLTFWDLTATEPRLLSTFPGPLWHATAVFPDAERVITGDANGAQMWQLTARGWSKVYTVPVAFHQGVSVTWTAGDGTARRSKGAAAHPSGRYFALVTAEGVTVRRTEDGSEATKFPLPAPAWNLEFAPDGRHLFVANGFGTVYVLRLPDLTGAADRAAAEWALSVGGSVAIADATGEREVKAAKGLPAGAFVVRHINVAGRGDGVTDADFARLKGLARLRTLHFGNTKVTDAGLAHLSDLTELTSLEWGTNAITGPGLVHLAKCRELDSVQFYGTPLTDEGFAHLRGATKLVHANLAGTKLTDASLAVCKGFANLNHLNLGGTAVTDAGLAHLAGLDKLQILYLGKTGVTAAGVQKLAKALPKCRIEWDGGTIEPQK